MASGHVTKRYTIQPKTLQDLKNALKEYDYYKKILLDSHKGVSEMFEKFYKTLGENDLVTVKIKNDIEKEMMPLNHLKRDPIVLVSGQLNSGKSSLINEILEKNSFVPVESTPCTSRIVRIKYSDEEYYQIFNKDDEPISRRMPYTKTDKKALKKAIKLRSTSPGRPLEPDRRVDEYVVIGMKSDILKSGIQIVDTPGMNESETLDKIVQECLDGVLQVLIYVIDANPSQRGTDHDFLNKIKKKAPNMKILYVCNKCEENEVAREYDMPSDEEDDEDETDNGDCQQPPTAQDSDSDSVESGRPPKGVEVFRRLKSQCHIAKEEKVETCDHFFQLSCRLVRLARCGELPKSADYEVMHEFQRLIDCTIVHFQDCVKVHLFKTATTLYSLATCAFDFFMSDKILTRAAHTSLREKIAETRTKENEAMKKITGYIENQKEQFHGSIRTSLEENKAHIIEESRKLKLDIDDSSKTWSRDLTRNYRRRLAEFLLYTLGGLIRSNKTIKKLLQTIESEVISQIQELYEDCRNMSGFGDLQTQLESCYNALIIFPATSNNNCENRCILKKALSTRIYTVLENFVFEHIRAPNCSIDEWKRRTLRRLLDSVVTEELGKNVCQLMKNQIEEAHEKFQNILSVISRTIDKRSAHQRCMSLIALIPNFSQTICTLRAVNSNVTGGEGQVAILDVISDRQTGRSKLFRCTYRGKEAAARCANGSDQARLDEFAKQINFTRYLQRRHINLIYVMDVYLSPDGILYAIVPMIEGNLFNMLCNEITKSLKDRLLIAFKIVQACVYAEDSSFRMSDLRPNNILMNRDDPVVNILKSRDLEKPYPAPDGMPPFHLAPEIISHKPKGTHHTHDVYSCVILAWWLAMGKFARPRFADTTDFSEIKAVITGDLARVRDEMREVLEKSDARRNASGSENLMFDKMQDLIEANIRPANERMSLAAFRDNLEKIILKVW